MISKEKRRDTIWFRDTSSSVPLQLVLFPSIFQSLILPQALSGKRVSQLNIPKSASLLSSVHHRRIPTHRISLILHFHPIIKFVIPIIYESENRVSAFQRFLLCINLPLISWWMRYPFHPPYKALNNTSNLHKDLKKTHLSFTQVSASPFLISCSTAKYCKRSIPL